MVKFYIRKKLGGLLWQDIVNGQISNTERELKIRKEPNYLQNLERVNNCS